MNRFANFARSSLSEYLPANATELSVEHPERFPYGNFTAVIWNKGFAAPSEDDGREIVLVTRTEAGMTIQRGLEGTEAADWNTGSLIANVVTADTLNSISAFIAARTLTQSGAIEPSDSFVLLSYAENESVKTFTLPEAALFSGNMLTIMNCGSGMTQFAVLSTAENDVIGFDGQTQVIVGAGCTLRISVINGIWQITGTEAFSPRSFQQISTSGQLNACGTVVYADASQYPLSLYIADNPAMRNVPFPVLKSDSSANKITLYHQSTGSVVSELSKKGECAWLMLNGSGGVEVLSASGGGSSGSANLHITATGFVQLSKEVSLVFADTSNGYAYVSLGSASQTAGQKVTVIRTDSTPNPVMVGGLSGGEYFLNAEGDYASFACSGTKWFRAG
ncbi:hypothetical protein [Seleniivibrio woodruffii]|uniref:hypothetical protein n=1 Tax=Seleniivibrio woodruffii TaxID=1078050 RepID=UPI002409B24A|nr:hypothetical protein [Seleniivibrio woodruffii]